MESMLLLAHVRAFFHVPRRRASGAPPRPRNRLCFQPLVALVSRELALKERQPVDDKGSQDGLVVPSQGVWERYMGCFL